MEDTRSGILKSIASELRCNEGEIKDIREIKDKAGVQAVGFRFTCGPAEYEYDYEKKGWRKV